jgi:hypothetical protein
VAAHRNARSRGDALAPIVPPLIEKRFDEEAAGVAEHRDQQKDPDADPGDPQPLLAEVDLQLITRCGFHADRRQRRHALRAANVGHRALDRPHAHHAPALSEQPLDDDRIASGRPLVERPGLLAPIVG